MCIGVRYSLGILGHTRVDEVLHLLSWGAFPVGLLLHVHKELAQWPRGSWATVQNLMTTRRNVSTWVPEDIPAY